MSGNGPERPPRAVGLHARWAIVLASLAIIAVAVLVVVLLTGDSPSGTAPAPSTTGTQPQSTVTVTATPEPTANPATKPTTTPSHRTFKYQPLWPFTSESAAATWQQAYRSGGQQPWHLDPGQTAMTFTHGFLDFDEIGLVVSRSVQGDEAFVSVGYQAGKTPPSVAAVIHLARLGQGDDAPWEVVGTRDSTLTLTQPRYGAVAGSPLTVGGRITGVDEAIRVDVRQTSTGERLGTYCCAAAGGERQPWSAQVTFAGATDPVVVIIASTGGHYQSVERFAVTAARAAD